MTETPIETQPQGGAQEHEAKTFDAEYVDKLRKEAAKYRTEAKANADAARQLSEMARSSKTLEDRVAEIERTAAAAEERALRAEVANAKGLTPTQARRLIGATRDELEADADALLKDIGVQMKRGNTAPKEGGAADTPGAGTDDMRAFARGLFGRAD